MTSPRRRYGCLLGIGLVLSITCPNIALGGERIGEAHWWGPLPHQLIQYWETVSNNKSKHRRYLVGTIKEIRHNVPLDPPFQDGDWNIYVLPAPGSSDLLTNSHNIENGNGLIELEIYTPFSLWAYFKVGDVIEAYGWHVEDLGHDPVWEVIDPPGPGSIFVPATFRGGKTELHPFIYLKAGTESDFMVFFGQDRSERFTVAKHNLNNYFSGFDINLGSSTRVPLIGQVNVPSNTSFLMETAQVDFAYDLYGATLPWFVDMWNDARSKIATTHQPGVVSFQTNLKGNHPLLSPLYFAQFRKWVEPLLTEEIIPRVVTDSDGQQALIAAVKVQLHESVAAGVFAYNTWQYDETLLSQNVRTTKEPVDRKIEFEATYSPARSLNNNEWVLDVLAGTRPKGWTPGVRTSQGQTGVSEKENRAFAQERRTYFIERSSLQVTQTPIAKEFPTGDVRNPVMKCTVGVRLDGRVATPHPEITVEKMKWHVVIRRDASGNVPPTLTAKTVPDGQVMDLGQILLETDAAGNLTINLGMNSQAILTVYGDARTGLGEILSSTEEVGMRLCMPRLTGNKEITPMNLNKLYLAYIILQKLGLPPTIPQKWSAQVRKAWPQNPIEPLGPPYKWSRRSLPKEGQQLMSAIRAVMKGERIDKKMEERLVTAISRVAELPDIKFIEPPKSIPAPIGVPQPMERPTFGGPSLPTEISKK